MRPWADALDVLDVLVLDVLDVLDVLMDNRQRRLAKGEIATKSSIRPIASVSPKD